MDTEIFKNGINKMICLQQIIIKLMKGILLAFDALELIGSLIMTAQQIEAEILKKKINDIVSSHFAEFQYIKKIDDLFKSLGSNAILTNALVDSNRISQMNWKIIADNLNQTVRVMNDLTANYKDVKLTNYQMTLDTGLNLGIAIMGSGMALNDFSKKYLGASSVQDGNRKLRGRMQKDKIVRCQLVIEGKDPIILGDGEVKLTENVGKPKGSVKQVKIVQVSGNVKASLKAPKNSVFTKISHFGSRIGKALIKVLKVVGLAAMMYEIYVSQKQITELISVYQQSVNQFGEGGQFKKNEVEILNTMTSVAELIANLAYASYAAIIDISNSSLICGLTFSAFNDYFLNQAAKFDPVQMGVGLNYCQSSVTLFKNLALIDVHENSSANQFAIALEKAHNFLEAFIKTWDPMKKHSHLAQQFIDFNSMISLFTQNNLPSEYLVNDFKKQFLSSFNRRNVKFADIQKRLSLGQINQSAANIQRERADKVLVKGLTLEYIMKIYNLRSNAKPLDIDEIVDYSDIMIVVPQAELKILGSIILSFTNTIYSEGVAGDKLFNLSVSIFKTNTTYQLFTQNFQNAPNTIPMPKLAEPYETNKINEFNVPIQNLINQSKMMNINDPAKFTILQKTRVINMHILIGHIIINGVKHDRIEFRKGIVIYGTDKSNNSPKFFIVSQSTINGEWAVFA